MNSSRALGEVEPNADAKHDRHVTLVIRRKSVAPFFSIQGDMPVALI